MNKKYAIALFILTFYSISSVAQDGRNAWFQLGFGTNAYKGDLQGYNKWTPSIHFGVIFNKKKRLNGEFNFNIGSLVGDNPNYVFSGNPKATPNIFFQTSFFNVNYQLHLNLIKNERFKIYLFQGIGVLNFNAKNELNENLIQKKSTRAPNEIPNNFCITLPNGIGLLYTLKNNFGFGIQTGFANTRTDYLDNISAWGNQTKKDNVLFAKFQVLVPLKNAPKTRKKVEKEYFRSKFSH